MDQFQELVAEGRINIHRRGRLAGRRTGRGRPRTRDKSWVTARAPRRPSAAHLYNSHRRAIGGPRRALTEAVGTARSGRPPPLRIVSGHVTRARGRWRQMEGRARPETTRASARQKRRTRGAGVRQARTWARTRRSFGVCGPPRRRPEGRRGVGQRVRNQVSWPCAVPS